MTSLQEARFTMYLVVRDYLSANTAITTTLPNYSVYSTAFLNGITQIQGIRQNQETNKGGLTTNKNTLKASLATLAAELARKLVAYANFAGNALLAGEVDYTLSDLKKSPDTILYDKALLIYTRANTNLAALTGHGVTAATQTAYMTALTNYNTAISKPELGKDDKKEATKLLALAFKSIDDNFKKLDDLIETVRFSQPSFYREYKNTRMIKYIGGRSLALHGTITDKASGEAISGVKIKIKADTGTPALRGVKGADFVLKKSAKKGGFQVKTLAEGDYTIVFSEKSYKEVVMKVIVADGKTSEVNVELEKR